MIAVRESGGTKLISKADVGYSTASLCRLSERWGLGQASLRLFEGQADHLRPLPSQGLNSCGDLEKREAIARNREGRRRRCEALTWIGSWPALYVVPEGQRGSRRQSAFS